LEFQYRCELARSHSQLGTVLARQPQRLTEAEAAIRQAITLRVVLVEEAPASRELRQELALTHLTLGRVLEMSNRASLAERTYRDALSQQEKMRAKYPRHPDSWHHLARCRVSLGLLLHEQGNLVDAKEMFSAADRVFRDGLKALPDYPEANNDFAWSLATCPQYQFRDAAQALALAKKAVAAQPRAVSYWTTLGTAHYRNGNWNDALEVLTKATGEFDRPSAATCFILSMTHWQLGTKEEARHQYDRAVALSAENNSLLIRRLQAEAKALISTQPIFPSSED
jgi:tetratricopeptide (TPR) repeat protein